jgi:hypothetical protein
VGIEVTSSDGLPACLVYGHGIGSYRQNRLSQARYDKNLEKSFVLSRSLKAEVTRSAVVAAPSFVSLVVVVAPAPVPAGSADPRCDSTVVGTAVRTSGVPPLARPFATELGGRDFAKLVMAGWVPAGIALGISVAALHDDLLTTSSGPWGTGNAEVPAYTDLMVQVRQDARSRLEEAIRRVGADCVVVSAMTAQVRSEACRAHPGGTDHFAEAVTMGTAVPRFGSQPLPPRHRA